MEHASRRWLHRFEAAFLFPRKTCPQKRVRSHGRNAVAVTLNLSLSLSLTIKFGPMLVQWYLQLASALSSSQEYRNTNFFRIRFWTEVVQKVIPRVSRTSDRSDHSGRTLDLTKPMCSTLRASPVKKITKILIALRISLTDHFPSGLSPALSLA